MSGTIRLSLRVGRLEGSYILARRRRILATPNRPEPKRIIEPGSGTACGTGGKGVGHVGQDVPGTMRGEMPK